MSIHLTEDGAARRAAQMEAIAASPAAGRRSSGWRRLRYRVRKWRFGLWRVEAER